MGYYKNYNSTIKAYKGIREMLHSLKEHGFKLGIVTEKLKEYAEIELHNTGLKSFFEVILAKEDCLDFKPSPIPLLQLAEKLNLKPSDCLCR